MNLNFSQALQMAKDGYRIKREGWNGKDMYVEAQYPDEHSKMRLPYLFMKTAQGHLVPWLVSQSDLFENDWSYHEAN